ncbi:MAG: uracil-DNA glycosylase [Nannocystaceae bacterium]|nr:uracil-DNA glycosylase [Nannocystaceae bacterium]
MSHGDGEHPRVLARQFAAALAELRDGWGVQYWPAGALPRAAASPSRALAAPPEPSAPLPPPAVAPDEPPAPLGAPVEPSAPVAVPTSLPIAAAAPELRDRAASWDAATKLEYLRRKNVGDCQRCGLSRTRTKIVFGVGNPEAAMMFVGEAPGADEDRQGEPFVGRAGQRLDEWLVALGLRRDDVYIANVLKCRPPGNRDPRPEEVDRCAPFLQAQIRAIAPRVLIALGRHAGMLLTRREDLSLRAMRGASLHYEVRGAANDPGPTRRIPIVVTYHPAYVLRQEGADAGGENATELVMKDLRRALELSRDATSA